MIQENKLNLAIGLFLMLIIQIGCKAQPNNFLNEQVERTIICDTVFDESIRSGYLITSLREKVGSETQEYNGKIYYPYIFSSKKSGQECLLREEHDKLLIFPKYIKPSNLKKDQVLMDFKSKVGDNWKLTHGGIFSNSIITLDSIHYNKVLKDKIYFLSAEPVFDIKDKTRLKHFSISRSKGVLHVTLINWNGYEVECDCR
ncbi:MAG: hypothetical protein AAF693_19660 [Bacteroidota bacterium]